MIFLNLEKFSSHIYRYLKKNHKGLNAFVSKKFKLIYSKQIKPSNFYFTSKVLPKNNTITTATKKSVTSSSEDFYKHCIHSLKFIQALYILVQCAEAKYRIIFKTFSFCLISPTFEK